MLDDLLADRLHADDLLQRRKFGGQLGRRLLHFLGQHLQWPDRPDDDQRTVLHHVGNDGAASVEHDGAGGALRHIEIDRAVIGGGDAADGAANRHGGDRRADLHVAIVRDLAGYKGQRALHQIEQLRVRRALRVVDEFVDDEARIGGQIERAAVVESDAERAGHGLQHIALEDGFAGLRRHGDAIADDGRVTARLDDAADRLGRRLRGAGLGVLPRRQRTGQRGDHIGRQRGAFGREQPGTDIGGEIVMDDKGFAVFAGQEQVGAGAAELCGE